MQRLELRIVATALCKPTCLNTCIIVDLLERILGKVNRERGSSDKIVYQIVSSTRRLEWLKSRRQEDCDCDRMIVIALTYGKEAAVLADRRQNLSTYQGSNCEDEIILQGALIWE